MKLTRQQRLLGGGLLLALVVWGLDALSGGGRPTAAQAAGATAPPADPAATAEPEDITALLERLTRNDYASVTPEIEQLPRDLFVPTRAIEDALGSAAEAANPQTPDADAAEEFRNQHRLVGVVIGRAALAVIDDRVVPIHGVIDGFRVIAVHRDDVVLQHVDSGTRVTLPLQPRPASPKGE